MYTPAVGMLVTRTAADYRGVLRSRNYTVAHVDEAGNMIRLVGELGYFSAENFSPAYLGSESRQEAQVGPAPPTTPDEAIAKLPAIPWNDLSRQFEEEETNDREEAPKKVLGIFEQAWINTPEETPKKVQGRKDDRGKLDLTLLFDDCPHAIEAVAEVMQWAVRDKQPVPYERGSWQGVSDLQTRYRAAALRHMLHSAKQQVTLGAPSHLARDPETHLLNLAHVATDALFQLEMACREINKLKAQAAQETR